MTIGWSALVLLAAEFTFAVLFLRALLGYLHRHDPLQRDVALVFLPCTLLFAASLVRQLRDGRPLPVWISAIVVTVLLAQPYLTVRLAGRLRAVPSWLHVAVLTVSALVATPLIFAPRPLSDASLTAMTVAFCVNEALAAGLLYGKAVTRTGANRARLVVASVATLTFGGMVVLIGLRLPAPVMQLLGLISGLGYLVAFLPPVWLRRMFAATAAQKVTERLLRAPAESPEQVWQIYAEIMLEQTGADAVAVLLPDRDGELRQSAYAGPPLPTPVSLFDVSALLDRAGQPARVRQVVAHYDDEIGDDFVIVLGMPVPPDIRGAVLLFNQHRTLFDDDDLRLLASLGGQAGILAERQAALDAQRRHVTALTRANAAKTAFLTNMSHELRTPLNAIIGFSDLMRMEEPEGDRRRVPAEWIEHIHTSGRHLLGLINDILDLAKVEAGRLELRVAPLRADTAVQELLTGLSPLFTTKDIAVETALPPATVLADRVRFRQIVENLLSNAIKFTPEGGKITVTVRASGSGVHVSVTDTGVGISPDDQAKIFEEFQQVGDEEKQRFGTGLGLSLIRQLAEAHGGEITVRSVVGQGSTFAVRLPAAPLVHAGPVHSRPVAAPDEPYILVIEDDPHAVELMRAHLGSAGYRVEVAGDGETGIATARDHAPDAVLLDVALPGIDGWEVIRRFKADERLAGIPVFFASMLDDRQAGLALGARDWFVKPVRPETLLTALASAIAARPSPRVLVVDQDAGVRRAIEDGLRAGGADVVACASGPEGLARSREEEFDLIVCDMHTPAADGLELLRDPATRNTPVLGLSAATGGVFGEHHSAG